MSTAAPELDLLQPWSLKAEMPSHASRSDALRAALQAALAALESPADQARSSLDAAIGALPNDFTQPLAEGPTGTPLLHNHVDDYNRYFGVRHLDSELPEVTLVRSMLSMLRRFIDLCEQCAGLDAHDIAQQKQGLRAQTLLLSRALNLDETGR